MMKPTRSTISKSICHYLTVVGVVLLTGILVVVGFRMHERWMERNRRAAHAHAHEKETFDDNRSPLQYTQYTNSLQEDKSFTRGCLQNATMSHISQPHPLPRGSVIRAKLPAPAYGGDSLSSSSSDVEYHKAFVVQYVKQGDLLYDHDLVSAVGEWTDESNGTSYPFKDTRNIGSVMNGDATDIIPSVPMTIYRSVANGYIVEFEDQEVHKQYITIGYQDAQRRVVPVRDIIPLPLQKTVDACATQCLHVSESNGKYVQVGGCDGKGCHCMCIPSATESTDSCDSPLVSTTPEVPYNVYNIDPYAAENERLLHRLLSSNGTESSGGGNGGSGISTNGGTPDSSLLCSGTNNGHSGKVGYSASSTDTNQRSNGCSTACLTMNGGGEGMGIPVAEICKSSASDIQRIIQSVPKTVVFGSTLSPASCSSPKQRCVDGGDGVKRPCKFLVTETLCHKNSQCEWTNRPYKYESTISSNTSGSACTTTTENVRDYISQTYQCINKRPTQHTDGSCSSSGNMRTITNPTHEYKLQPKNMFTELVNTSTIGQDEPTFPSRGLFNVNI